MFQIKLKPFFITLSLIFCALSCGQEKDNLTYAQPADDSDTNYSDSIQKMQAMQIDDTIKWRGKTYHYSISRRPDNNLPIIKDEHQISYIDNRIELTVKTDGNNVFYHKVFTKTDFAGFLDNDLKKRGILEGFVFYETEPDGLHFAASVSDPSQDDWYMPFSIILTSKGQISIQRDQTLDTTPADNGDDGV